MQSPSALRSVGGAILKVSLVVIVLGAGAFVGRNTQVAERLRGDNYDYEMLPAKVYPRGGIVRGDTTSEQFSVGLSGGVATESNERQNSTINLNSYEATVEIVQSVAPIVAGVVGATSGTPTIVSYIAKDGFLFVEPGTPDGVWTRIPQPANTQLSFGAGAVVMYQDVVDSSLRNIKPVTVVTGRLGLVDVTTYTFQFPFGEFYESAPTIFERLSVLEGNASPESPVEVTLSVDADGVVWLLDVSLVASDVLAHATTQAKDGLSYPYRIVYELRAVSTQPATITAPANFVDASAPDTSGEG